jgi:hypothetical protein
LECLFSFIRDWAKPLGDLDAARAWLAGRNDLESVLKPRHFLGVRLGDDDDVLDFFVGHLVDVDLTRQPAA